MDVRVSISSSCMTRARPTPPTLSRCAPLTRHGPELTASICQVAVEVPSLVVGICALGTMSWNTHQNTQPLRCNCYKTRFILLALCCSPTYIYIYIYLYIHICYKYKTGSVTKYSSTQRSIVQLVQLMQESSSIVEYS